MNHRTGETAPQGWQFEQGSDLVLNPGAAWAITSNGTPGTIRVRYRLEYENGMVFSAAPATIVVKDYPQVKLQYVAFIECKVVPGPLPILICGDHGEGDDRGFSANFPPSSWRVRIAELTTPRSFLNVGDYRTGLLTTPSPLGITKLYSRLSVNTAAPGVAAWPFGCSSVPTGDPCLESGQGWTPAKANLVLRRTGTGEGGGSQVIGDATMAVANAYSPDTILAIDSHVGFALLFQTNQQSGNQVVKFSAEVSHDQFPSYEFHINSTRVYEYSHTANGQDVLGLDRSFFSRVAPPIVIALP